MQKNLMEELKTQEKFFLNTVSVLTEENSTFKPTEEMYTVAQQIAHAADTISWFFEGAFGENGFDMSFDNFNEKMKAHTSFDNSIKYLKDEFAKAIAKLEVISDDELEAPIDGPIMKGFPKKSIVGALVDHTAHHRGALSVYARLLGKTPQMPYGQM
jgi:uncharacterized damage-inducible protein DinB